MHRMPPAKHGRGPPSASPQRSTGRASGPGDALMIQAPPGVPRGARFVGSSPLGDIWAYTGENPVAPVLRLHADAAVSHGALSFAGPTQPLAFRVVAPPHRRKWAAAVQAQLGLHHAGLVPVLAAQFGHSSSRSRLRALTTLLGATHTDAPAPETGHESPAPEAGPEPELQRKQVSFAGDTDEDAVAGSDAEEEEVPPSVHYEHEDRKPSGSTEVSVLNQAMLAALLPEDAAQVNAVEQLRQARFREVRTVTYAGYEGHLESVFRGQALATAAVVDTVTSLAAALAYVHRHPGMCFATMSPFHVVFATPSVASGEADRQRRVMLAASFVVPDAATAAKMKALTDIRYAAPEVVHGAAFGPAADMWSLGCILVRCLTGQPMWSDVTPSALLQVLRDLATRERSPGPRPALSRCGRHLMAPLPYKTPRALKHIVGRLLIIDPAKRMTAAELMADPGVAELAAKARPAPIPEAPPAPARSSLSRPPPARKGLLPKLDPPKPAKPRAPPKALAPLAGAHSTWATCHHGSTEFEAARRWAERAALQGAPDALEAEVVAVTSLQNPVLAGRFDAVAASIGGQRSLGCYGADPRMWRRITRVGILPRGHPLRDATVGRRDHKTAMEASRTLSFDGHDAAQLSKDRGEFVGAIALARHPLDAARYSLAPDAPLDVGTECQVLVCDVALGATCDRQSRLRQVGFDDRSGTSESDAASPGTPCTPTSFNSLVSELEIVVTDATQACPKWLVTLRFRPPALSTGVLPVAQPTFHVMINDVLGAGAFGRVCKAVMFPAGLPLAVKIFGGLHSDEGKCRAEFDTLLRLQDYRHVVRVHHFEFRDDTAYMFMDLLALSVEDLVRRCTRLSEACAVRYMQQAARGLLSLQHERIVHRDIKPANLLISHDGILKLADFGLSPDAIGRVASYVPAGTPCYLAPELLRGAAPHTHASDVWALACSVVYMLSGRHPHDTVGGAAAVSDFLRTAPDPAPAIPDAVSPVLRALLLRCFATDPAGRPTCEALAGDKVYYGAGADAPSTATDDAADDTTRSDPSSVAAVSSSMGALRTPSAEGGDSRTTAPRPAGSIVILEDRHSTGSGPGQQDTVLATQTLAGASFQPSYCPPSSI